MRRGKRIILLLLAAVMALFSVGFADSAWPYAISTQRYSGQEATAAATGEVESVTATQVVPYPAGQDLYAKSLYTDEDYDMPYAIIVDRTNQVITVVSKSEPGRYGVIEQQFICSTGASGSSTPLGKFKLTRSSRKEWRYFPTSRCYIRYAVRIYGNYFFHSILYNRQSMSSLNTTSYKNLGRWASHGCIRMLDEDAHWLSDNCEAGTLVWIMDGEKDEALRQSLLPNPYVSLEVRDFGRYQRYQ